MILAGVLVVAPEAALAREKLRKIGEATIHTWSREKDGNYQAEVLAKALEQVEQIVTKEVQRQSKEQVANTDLLSSMVQLANASKSAAPGLVVPVLLPVNNKFLGFAPSFSSGTFGLRSKVAKRVVQTSSEQQQKILVETIKPLLEEQMKTIKFLTVLNITGGFINPLAVEAAKQGANYLRRFLKKRYEKYQKNQGQKNTDFDFDFDLDEEKKTSKPTPFKIAHPINQVLEILRHNPVLVLIALIVSMGTPKGKEIAQKIWAELNKKPTEIVTKKSLIQQTFSYVRSHPLLILCVLVFCALSVRLFSLLLQSEGKTITEKIFSFTTTQQERTISIVRTAYDKLLNMQSNIQSKMFNFSQTQNRNTEANFRRERQLKEQYMAQNELLKTEANIKLMQKNELISEVINQKKYNTIILNALEESSKKIDTNNLVIDQLTNQRQNFYNFYLEHKANLTNEQKKYLAPIIKKIEETKNSNLLISGGSTKITNMFSLNDLKKEINKNLDIKVEYKLDDELTRTIESHNTDTTTTEDMYPFYDVLSLQKDNDESLSLSPTEIKKIETCRQMDRQYSFDDVDFFDHECSELYKKETKIKNKKK